MTIPDYMISRTVVFNEAGVAIGVAAAPLFVDLPPATIKALDNVPDLDQLYEFGNINGESKPVYIGQAPPGSLETDPVWTVQKYAWAASPVGAGTSLGGVKTRTGSWAGRAGLFA